eukprot:TRINITY_DN62240_c0_g1_i1.p1 TRINITY_DN62240_c0_g1~~TRINITY_DN62240_c0_g1_i1.p1  ORF type:complete len:142 (+),score=27.04 TRINITY_DN62240_c0_g1_i1:1-426(+)
MRSREYGGAAIAFRELLGRFALHPNHELRFDAHCSLASCAKMNGDSRQEAESLRAALVCLGQVLPAPSGEMCSLGRRLGACLLECVAVQSNRKLRQRLMTEAREVLEEALRCHAICFGSAHAKSAEVSRMLGLLVHKADTK